MISGIKLANIAYTHKTETQHHRGKL